MDFTNIGEVRLPLYRCATAKLKRKDLPKTPGTRPLMPNPPIFPSALGLISTGFASHARAEKAQAALVSVDEREDVISGLPGSLCI
jgi:hypothetical protein